MSSATSCAPAGGIADEPRLPTTIVVTDALTSMLSIHGSMNGTASEWLCTSMNPYRRRSLRR